MPQLIFVQLLLLWSENIPIMERIDLDAKKKTVMLLYALLEALILVNVMPA